MKNQNFFFRNPLKNFRWSILLFFATTSITLSAQTIQRKAFTTGNAVNNVSLFDIDEVALDPTFLATTAHTAGGFEITIWNVTTSSITKKTSKTGSFAPRILKSAKLSSTRFVNVYVTSSNLLRLQVWDINTTGTVLTLKNTKDGDPAGGAFVNIISLSSTRFVTFSNHPDNYLTMTVWDITSTGIISRKGSISAHEKILANPTALSSGKFVSSNTDIDGFQNIVLYAVSSNGDISYLDEFGIGSLDYSIRLSTLTPNRFTFAVTDDFFQEDHLYTTSISASNQFVQLGSATLPVSAYDKALTTLNSTNIVSAAIDGQTDQIKLHHYKIASDGSFTLKDEEITETGEQIKAVTMLTTTTLSRIVTAFINNTGNLRLVSWDINVSAAKPENTTAIENNIEVPFDITAYPNPVSDNASFKFHLNEDSNASLKIYNLLGELVKELATGNYTQGDHEVNWSVETIPAGVYYYSFETADKQVTQKLVITH